MNSLLPISSRFASSVFFFFGAGLFLPETPTLEIMCADAHE
jgi:hypothetical protein